MNSLIQQKKVFILWPCDISLISFLNVGIFQWDETSIGRFLPLLRVL